jgi:hypothetical protein
MWASGGTIQQPARTTPMHTRRFQSLVLAATISLACAAPSPDLASDHAALLRLHEEQRTAHVQRQAELLTGSFADTFYSIGRGRVTTPSRAASTARFQAYFEQAAFRAWDDLAPPVIRISPDGRMAYVIVQKRVGLQPIDSTTVPDPDTIYAWLSTYEKIDGQWRLTALASTDRVDDPSS